MRLIYSPGRTAVQYEAWNSWGSVRRSRLGGSLFMAKSTVQWTCCKTRLTLKEEAKLVIRVNWMSKLLNSEQAYIYICNYSCAPKLTCFLQMQPEIMWHQRTAALIFKFRWIRNLITFLLNHLLMNVTVKAFFLEVVSINTIGGQTLKQKQQWKNIWLIGPFMTT